MTYEIYRNYCEREVVVVRKISKFQKIEFRERSEMMSEEAVSQFNSLGIPPTMRGRIF